MIIIDQTRCPGHAELGGVSSSHRSTELSLYPQKIFRKKYFIFKQAIRAVSSPSPSPCVPRWPTAPTWTSQSSSPTWRSGAGSPWGPRTSGSSTGPARRPAGALNIFCISINIFHDYNIYTISIAGTFSRLTRATE